MVASEKLACIKIDTQSTLQNMLAATNSDLSLSSLFDGIDRI